MGFFQKIIKLAFLLFIVVGYQNCGQNNSSQNTANSSANNKASFTWINENIVKIKCESCHNNNIAFANRNFTTYEGILETIQPGAPEESSFYTRSFTTTFFELTDQERDIIYIWIQNGALQD